MRSLRPDQHEALDSLRQAMCDNLKHVVMQASTGFGKTLLAAELVMRARAKGKKALFIVPAISLVDQTVEMFTSQGISEFDIGVLQANHRQTDGLAPIQVASVQTLMRREMPPADVVMIDEVHKWFDKYETWLKMDWKDTPVIGLSATPWRKGLGTYFSKLIRASTTQDLIDKGLLSDFKVWAPSHPDLEDIRTVGGDYDEEQLSERMSSTKLVADIVETWLEHGRGRPTLCFAVDRAHAEKLKQQFEARGIKTAYQDAFTGDARRAEIKAGFHNGTFEIVVNIGTLTTGVDWDVRCIILARPTKSEMLFVQIMGRGLRTANGKDHLLVLDHSMNHLNLGFVTDIDVSHTELYKCGDRKTNKVTDHIRMPKECPSCAFLKPPKMAKCPMCGFVAVAHSKIEPTPGELKELKRKEKEVKDFVDPRVFYSELLSYANMKGYNWGWASHKFMAKFGRWPDGMRDVCPAAAVSDKTESWIKSQKIRNWKSPSYQQWRQQRVDIEPGS